MTIAPANDPEPVRGLPLEKRFDAYLLIIDGATTMPRERVVWIRLLSSCLAEHNLPTPAFWRWCVECIDQPDHHALLELAATVLARGARLDYAPTDEEIVAAAKQLLEEVETKRAEIDAAP